MNELDLHTSSILYPLVSSIYPVVTRFHERTMCIFAFPTTTVNSTALVCMPRPGSDPKSNESRIMYMNQVESPTANAMILPIKGRVIPPFIEVDEKFYGLDKDIRDGTAKWENRGMRSGGSWGTLGEPAAMGFMAKIELVGSYYMSTASNLKQIDWKGFGEIDSKHLPAAIEFLTKRYPQDDGYSFVVAKIAPDQKAKPKKHPIVFDVEGKSSNVMLPTYHMHHGQIETQSDFDHHVVAVNSKFIETEKETTFGWSAGLSYSRETRHEVVNVSKHTDNRGRLFFDYKWQDYFPVLAQLLVEWDVNPWFIEVVEIHGRQKNRDVFMDLMQTRPAPAAPVAPRAPPTYPTDVFGIGSRPTQMIPPINSFDVSLPDPPTDYFRTEPDDGLKKVSELPPSEFFSAAAEQFSKAATESKAVAHSATGRVCDFCGKNAEYPYRACQECGDVDMCGPCSFMAMLHPNIPTRLAATHKHLTANVPHTMMVIMNSLSRARYNGISRYMRGLGSN